MQKARQIPKENSRFILPEMNLPHAHQRIELQPLVEAPFSDGSGVG
jgi:hypothetical protein